MLRLINHVSVGVLWFLALKSLPTRKFPYLLCFLAALHLGETLVIGLRTGKRYGKGGLMSFCLSMVFGHAWWLPLHRQMKAEDLAADDFLRRDDGCLMKERTV